MFFLRLFLFLQMNLSLWRASGFCLQLTKQVESSLNAGFGGGSNNNQKKKKKSSSTGADAKLKPKQQWDRYSELKRENKIRVGVRIVGEENDKHDEWLEVGRIKSKENKYTEMAVYRQRAIIAEHSKRLYPLKVSIKKKIEWGYRYLSDSVEEWKTVDKSCMKDEVKGLERLCGFEGKPDAATGFYCVYDVS